jgi:hypothetical protein
MRQRRREIDEALAWLLGVANECARVRPSFRAVRRPRLRPAPVAGTCARAERELTSACWRACTSSTKTTWTPVDDQFVVGVEFVHEAPAALLGFELGVQGGFGGDEADVPGGGHADVTSACSSSTAACARRSLRDHPRCIPARRRSDAAQRLHSRSTADRSTADDDDTSVGAYAHVRRGSRAFEEHGGGRGPARRSDSPDIELFGSSGDADYFQGAVFLAVGL